MRIVARWETGLQNIRVCTQINSMIRRSSSALNCCRCEKCVRTMTELLALGKLPETRAFADNDVTASMMSRLAPASDYSAYCWRDLIEPLKAMRRYDLVRAVRRILRKYRTRQRIKNLDRRVFAGRLLRLARPFLKRSRYKTARRKLPR